MIKVFECLSNSGNAEISIERDYDSDGFHDDQYMYIELLSFYLLTVMFY